MPRPGVGFLKAEAGVGKWSYQIVIMVCLSTREAHLELGLSIRRVLCWLEIAWLVPCLSQLYELELFGDYRDFLLRAEANSGEANSLIILLTPGGESLAVGGTFPCLP